MYMECQAYWLMHSCNVIKGLKLTSAQLKNGKNLIHLPSSKLNFMRYSLEV